VQDHARFSVFVQWAGAQVGNEVFRGISGGERKRLTTAEQVC
jgi:hypothetical protein